MIMISWDIISSILPKLCMPLVDDVNYVPVVLKKNCSIPKISIFMGWIETIPKW